MNSELWIVSCSLTSGYRRLPTAYCRLPSVFEGSSSWRDSSAAPQPRTRCQLRERGKKT
jgi:hypothetical protein